MVTHVEDLSKKFEEVEKRAHDAQMGDDKYRLNKEQVGILANCNVTNLKYA